MLQAVLEPKFIREGGVGTVEIHFFLSAYFTGRKRIGRRTHNGEARKGHVLDVEKAKRVLLRRILSIDPIVKLRDGYYLSSLHSFSAIL